MGHQKKSGKTYKADHNFLMNKAYFISAFSVVSILGFGEPTLAAVINFDDQGLSGPSFFDLAGDAQTLNINTDFGNVRFEGGVILTNATNAPANRSSAYGTANKAGFGIRDNPTRKNPLTIEFASPIENFFLDVFNGLPVRSGLNYTVADDLGNFSTFSLVSNLQGGFQKIGFAAAGKKITVTADTSPGAASPFPNGAYDFFIDNIFFNAELPDDLLEPVEEVIVPTPTPTPVPTPTPMPTPTPPMPTPDPKSPDPASVPEPVGVLGILTVSALGFFRKGKR